MMLTACGAPPSSGAGTAPPDTLRVMAYNIHHGEGMDSVVDLERIAELIREVDPDLVALQEVDSVTERTGRVDQAAELGRLTGMTPVFGSFMPYQGGAYGMAVLSRWPVLESANLRLPDGLEPRTSVDMTVRTPAGDRRLRFVGIHFYATEPERLAQAQRLEELLESEEGPVILAGDFNSTPGSTVMSHLGRTWVIVDKGEDHLTFPSWTPEREIDFLLLRPDSAFQVLRHRPMDEPVISDHRPLVADLVLGG
jgi:endonuclease/exonuclease/phosphatase family metal-dependent hydrolase